MVTRASLPCPRRLVCTRCDPMSDFVFGLPHKTLLKRDLKP